MAEPVVDKAGVAWGDGVPVKRGAELLCTVRGTREAHTVVRGESAECDGLR